VAGVLPKYLSALGASGLIIGMFASAKDLLDGLYSTRGMDDRRFGRKRALMLFTLLASSAMRSMRSLRTGRGPRRARARDGLEGGCIPATFA